MPTDEDVLEVLRAWACDQNKLRAHLCKDNAKCWSDTFGLSRLMSVHINIATERYMSVQKLVTWWIKNKIPEAVFTTFVVNKSVPMVRHQDEGNVGPTILFAVGSFTGGGLRLWPEDTKEARPHNLPLEESIVVPLEGGKSRPVLFDGNKAHEVQPFVGERITVMAYTVKQYQKAREQDVAQLKELGYPVPTNAPWKHAIVFLLVAVAFPDSPHASVFHEAWLKYFFGKRGRFSSLV